MRRSLRRSLNAKMMRRDENDDSLPASKRPRVEGDNYGPSLTPEESYGPSPFSHIATSSLQDNELLGHGSYAAPQAQVTDGTADSVATAAEEGGRGRHASSVGSDDSFNSESPCNTPEPQQNEAGDDMDSNDDVDDVSELSNLSGLSEEAWQPVAGPISWVQRQMVMGQDPRIILQELIPPDTEIPEDYDQLKLWKIIINLLSEPPPRDKLPHINTFEDVVQLLQTSNKIIVLTGAGVSVSCGIPDFRSRDGIYARLAKDFPNLPDPQAMFDIDFFRSDQRPFFKFAKEIYPGQFEPSRCHKFIKLLETHGKLLRNYTQNIDTLEKVAGVQRVIECHGSFATATCMVCKYKVDAEELRKDIFDQVIPRCPHCPADTPLAVMKPDIVFFGESLPGVFHRQMAADKNECDLLIVIGSSLKVRPVALIPNSLPAHVPQIIINREPLTKRFTFDVELLGNCDDIVSELCKRLGDTWDHLAEPGPPATQVLQTELPDLRLPPSYSACQPGDVGNSGESTAEGGRLQVGVVEHNADSGLGDVEAVSSTNAISCSDSKELSRLDSNSEANSDRYERLSSSDSGVEPSALSLAGQGDALHHLTVPACTSCGDDSSSVTSATVHGTSVDNSTSEVVCGDSHEADKEKRPDVCTHSDGPDSEDGKQSESKPSSHHHHHSTEPDSTSEVHSPRKRTHSHMSDGGDKKMDLNRESQKDNAHCSHTDTIDEMRRMWIPRRRLSLASRVYGNSFIYVPPNRYIFRGAEVYSDDSDSDSDESGDDSPPSTPSQVGDADEGPSISSRPPDGSADFMHSSGQEASADLGEDAPQPSEVSSSNVVVD